MKYTREDLIDAFNWGRNFQSNITERKLKALLKDDNNLEEKAIENMFRDMTERR